MGDEIEGSDGTDGYVYLNVDDPVCAWAAVRSVFVSASQANAEAGTKGFVSMMSASLMKYDNKARLSNELVFEQARQARYSQLVSRISGIFLFKDLESANRAIVDWKVPYFREENRVDVNLQSARVISTYDSNWYTYAPRDNEGFFTKDVIESINGYWSGSPRPGMTPLWESIVDGRVVILGTEVRKRAFRVIEREMPECLGLLELSRAAAWIGSDLGSSNGFLEDQGDKVHLGYAMDIRDFSNKDFIERLVNEKAIVNYGIMKEDIEKKKLRLPDFEKYGFIRPKINMPYVV